MPYTDSYGSWKLLGNKIITEVSTFISVPASSDKILRFSYDTDWVEWDKSLIFRSKCLLRWHYGINQEMHSFFYALYPTKTSHLKEFSLISKGSLFPRELEIKLIPRRYKHYYHNVGLLPVTLKIEELLNE